MKNVITLIIVCLTIISCSELSKEELIIHNQKVTSGIKKKQSDLNRILSEISKQSNVLDKKFEKVNSFKIARSEDKKKKQIAQVKGELKEISNFRNRVKKLKKELDLPHDPFGFQSNPKRVVEHVFDAAKNKDFSTLLWLADPYDENDIEVDNISYTRILNATQQKSFINKFKKGKVVGEPIINENNAKVDFMYGSNGNIKKTMNLVKRNGAWYLSSF